MDDSEHSDDSTIFGQLRSNWLNDERGGRSWAANEVDRGWDAAERGREHATPRARPRPGCPYAVRAAGCCPVVSRTEPAKVVRDPEAIRNRLAAHAAGVSRGRAAAAAQPVTYDYAHEETGPA